MLRYCATLSLGMFIRTTGKGACFSPSVLSVVISAVKPSHVAVWLSARGLERSGLGALKLLSVWGCALKIRLCCGRVIVAVCVVCGVVSDSTVGAACGWLGVVVILCAA